MLLSQQSISSTDTVRGFGLLMTLDPQRLDASVSDVGSPVYLDDFADVKGLAALKRVLGVSASSGHNVQLVELLNGGEGRHSHRLP